MATELQDMIRHLAAENDIDPAYALAVAERESRFNPNARASQTIAGLFQMRGDHRRRYGVPDDADPETQTRGFTAFTKTLRDEMTSHLGRAPSSSELYLGHYLGGKRAADALTRHADLSPRDVFSPRELLLNPEFRKHATMGDLSTAVTTDMDKRMARYGGPAPAGTQTAARPDFTVFGTPETPEAPASVDLTAFGQPETPMSSFPPIQAVAKIDTPQNIDLNVKSRPGTEVDLRMLAQMGPPPAAQPDPLAALAQPYSQPFVPPDVAKGDIGAIRPDDQGAPFVPPPGPQIGV